LQQQQLQQQQLQQQQLQQQIQQKQQEDELKKKLFLLEQEKREKQENQEKMKKEYKNELTKLKNVNEKVSIKTDSDSWSSADSGVKIDNEIKKISKGTKNDNSSNDELSQEKKSILSTKSKKSNGKKKIGVSLF
jgi:hypothetical protein